MWAIAMRTLDNFEQALGRRLPWGFSGHHLYLVPAAFAEPCLLCLRGSGDPFRLPPPGQRIARIQLPRLRHGDPRGDPSDPRWPPTPLMEPSLPDQAAFHEGLADISALLSILTIQEVIEDRLGERDENGRSEADPGGGPEGADPAVRDRRARGRREPPPHLGGDQSPGAVRAGEVTGRFEVSAPDGSAGRER